MECENEASDPWYQRMLAKSGKISFYLEADREFRLNEEMQRKSLNEVKKNARIFACLSDESLVNRNRSLFFTINKEILIEIAALTADASTSFEEAKRVSKTNLALKN